MQDAVQDPKALSFGLRDQIYTRIYYNILLLQYTIIIYYNQGAARIPKNVGEVISTSPDIVAHVTAAPALSKTQARRGMPRKPAKEILDSGLGFRV